MMSLLSALQQARGWEDYYESVKKVYCAIVEGFAFGTPSFASHVHHTAIPDASLAVVGSLRISFYSQPDESSLLEFVSLFRALLDHEPRRARTAKFVFCQIYGEPVSVSDVRSHLGEWASRVDFCVTSWGAALSSRRGGVLDSTQLMASERWPLSEDIEGTESHTLKDALDRELGLWREGSVVPQDLRAVLTESSLVLDCAIKGVQPDLLRGLSPTIGLGAQLARSRAEMIQDGAVLQAYCRRIAAENPVAHKTRVVRAGDTLSRICREEYEVPWQMVWDFVLVANQMKDPNRIRVGQTLILPLLS